MSRQVRLSAFAVAAIGLAGLLLWSLAGLPDFGHYHWPYGKVLNAAAVGERHTTNVVGVTVFDYRGFDTLGEEFILFTAVIGVSLLLRRWHEDAAEPAEDVRSDAVRLTGLPSAALVLALGLWIVAFGYVTPGGGFQGGVLVAGSFLLVYLAGGYRDFHALVPHTAVEISEAAAAGAFVILGLVGLVSEGAYLRNFLGIGDTGTLFAGGSVPLLNGATAIEVSAALLVLFSEFLMMYTIPPSRWRP